MNFLGLTIKETKFILMVSLILIIVTSSVFIFGYLIRGDLFYNGLHISSPIDTPVYYANIAQVKEGHGLLDNLFSNEKNAARLFNIIWLAIGFFAYLFHLTPVWAYQIARIILTPVFLFVLYKFINYCLLGYTNYQKKFCFLYSIFASGLGTFALVLKNFVPSLIDKFSVSMDFWVPEGSNFLILFNSPHFLASLTLIILIFYCILLCAETKLLRYSLMAGILALALLSFHPYYALTIFGVPLVYFLVLFIKNKKIIPSLIYNYLIFGILAMPAILYYVFIYSTNLPFQMKILQYKSPTPGFDVFFISYGLGLLCAILAIIFIIKKKKLDNIKLFLIIWFLISILLIYSPVAYQRRLVEGFQIPLTILAFIGLVAIYNFLKNKSQIIRTLRMYEILPIFVLLFCFSNAIFYLMDLKYLSFKSDITYTPQAIITALDWYKNQTSEKETILSVPLNGNLIPGLISRRVFIGHGSETVNYEKKLNQIIWFFKDSQNDEAKKEFIKDNQIDYLFYSIREKALGQFNPQSKNYLKQVYDNNGVSIYKVILE